MGRTGTYKKQTPRHLGKNIPTAENCQRKLTDKQISDMVSKMKPTGAQILSTRLTEEEEADEIIRRLSAPPRPKYITVDWETDWSTGFDVNDVISEALSAQIVKEIDEEIMREIKRETETWQKQYLNIKTSWVKI